MTTSKLQRRSILTALFAAPVVAASPAVASAAKPIVTESPELLALGERLSPLLDALRMALVKKAEAAATYQRLAPGVPPGLIASRADQTRGLTDRQVDLFGAVKDAQGNYCDIYRSRNIRANLILWEISGRTKEGRRLHRLARLARARLPSQLCPLYLRKSRPWGRPVQCGWPVRQARDPGLGTRELMSAD